MGVTKNKERYCSFCGKSESQIRLFKGLGDNDYICADCIQLGSKYIDMLLDNHTIATLDNIPKPKEIKKFLDDYVIGQDAAKERIAVAVYNHYKRIASQENPNGVEIEKSNVMMVGPTGTGKTLIAKTIARMLDVPFTIVDSTVLTEAGYVGEDVETILTRLLQAADYDVEKTERGIIFIDEIDKIARKSDNPSLTRDVSGEGVQQGLLKLLEGSVVLVPPQGGRKHPDAKMVPVNTKNILFICGGAFEGIEKKIEQRYNVHSIGFDSHSEKKDKFDKENPLKHVSPRDLKSFGLIPELIGRVPVVTYMDNLDSKALRRILVEPKNALVKQYVELMKIDGINLTFEDDVLDYIVEKAEENKIGARGLRGIMEDLMTKVMFELPGTDTKEFNVTLDYAKSILDDITYKE